MKRLIYITTFVCLFGSFCSDKINSQLYFGFQTGIVFSKVGVNYNEEGTYNTALKDQMANVSNIFVSNKLIPRFVVAFEPGYTQKVIDLNSLFIINNQQPVFTEYNKTVNKLAGTVDYFHHYF